MGKGDPKKQRGKISSYTLLVQACQEEPQRKHPMLHLLLRVFQEVLREVESMSAKEKGKVEDKARVDKGPCERA